jgi:FtsP/CotA-like multicopper oxidase with cupredoxin domain
LAAGSLANDALIGSKSRLSAAGAIASVLASRVMYCVRLPGFGWLLSHSGVPLPPEEWEEGFKDTVIAYPGQVARIRARFDLPGLYVWHCHILEHEDHEMMRPYLVGPMPPNLPIGH